MFVFVCVWGFVSELVYVSLDVLVPVVVYVFAHVIVYDVALVFD